jgi:hypothetical protein
MSYTIAVIDQYRYHRQVVFGLRIEAPRRDFPLFVGATIKSRLGETIDLPARWLISPGLALWEVKVPNACRDDQQAFSTAGWSGTIKFALWKDEKFTRRLADTDWLPWSAPYLIGASTTGLAMQDEAIKEKYINRFNVWKE